MNVRVSYGGGLRGIPQTPAISTQCYELTLQSDGSWLIADLTLRRSAPSSDLLAARITGRQDTPQIGPFTPGLSLQVPISSISATLPPGASLRGQAARLLYDHAQAFDGYRRDRAFADCAQAHRETCELVAECMRSLDARCAPDEWRPSRRFWWHRVWWHIERHLADPALSPASLSSDLGLSRSALYRHFAPQGGLVHYICDRRLEAVRARIAAADHPWSVHALGPLAHQYGLRSTARLHRLFARKFGCSPTDVDFLRQNRSSPTVYNR